MKQRLRTEVLRYAAGLALVAAITVVSGRFLHLNPTTVALGFLLLVLVASAYWGLRCAIVLSVAATLAFNFFFLPPLGTFTVADPQNWVALLAFLVTAIIASNLAERARREADHAIRRRREIERLYRFSQRLLSTDNVVELLNAVPRFVVEDFELDQAALLLQGKGSIYKSDPAVNVAREQMEHTLVRGEISSAADYWFIPLHIGVRSVGALAISGSALSPETMDAMGSLIGVSIQRAGAVEELTKTEIARENERLRSALLDSVTHEFRTPLTSIKASISTLMSQIFLDEAQRSELLTVIDEETDRLNRLVGEAAEMAQLDAHMFTLDIDRHNIREAIDAAMAESRSLLQDRTVAVSIAPECPALPMDLKRIEEVLKHLLENAARYSPPQTAITITSEVREGEVVTSVADHGPGIDEFEQALIFEKFYRGRDQRYAVNGTGMGLAIARVIVEAHGGRIGVISQLNHGSVFHFTLPIAAPTST